MNLNDIRIPLNKEQINNMTVNECRARMALIETAAARGDFNWSFDENVMLTIKIPEEKKAMEKAFKQQAKSARARIRRK